MEEVYKKIISSAGRITKIKKAIIDALLESCCFLTKTELIKKLKSKKIHPDRSTIYRELKFLEKNNIVIRNTILGTDYYEIPQTHHHHLVCVKCNKIDKVEIDNRLKKEEKQIAQKNKFNIINHSLEFYGYCHKCQS